MAAEYTDRGVRLAMHMGAEHAAHFAGVSRETLYRYELGPTFVSPPQRLRCDRFYACLRRALKTLQSLENIDGQATPALRTNA